MAIARFNPVMPADTGPLVNHLVGLGQQQQQQEAQQAQQKHMQDLAVRALDDDNAMASLSALNPNAANALRQVISTRDQASADAIARESEAAARDASVLLDLQGDAQTRAIIELAQRAHAAGRDISSFQQLLEMSPDQRKLELTRDLREIADAKTLLARHFPGTEKFHLKETADGSLKFIGEQGTVRDTGEQAPERKPLVEINNEAEQKGDTEEQKAAAKLRVKQAEEIANRALAAEDELNFIGQLKNIDIATAPGESLKLMGREFGAMLGLPVDESKIANAQSFNAIAGRMVLNVMSTQKGPQTDADQKRIAATLPNIDNPQSAKNFLTASAEAIARRKVEHGRFYTEFFEREGTYRGVKAAWDKFKRETPMISDNVKDPNTGLPVFFFQYQQTLRELNPGMSDEEILTRWRSRAGG